MADDDTSFQVFLEQHPDIEIFEMLLPDVCGGLRGKWVPRCTNCGPGSSSCH